MIALPLPSSSGFTREDLVGLQQRSMNCVVDFAPTTVTLVAVGQHRHPESDRPKPLYIRAKV